MIDDPDGLLLSLAASENDGETYLATGGTDSTVTVYEVNRHGVHRRWHEQESSQGAVTAMCFGWEAVLIFYSPEDAMRWCAYGAFQRER